MAHIPDDQNFDDFMNASAEDWSEPEKPTPPPEMPEEKADRWGAPIPEPAAVNDGDRWGAPELDSADTPKVSDFMPEGKSKKSKGWLIAIIVVAALCLCVCVVLTTLALTGVITIPKM